MSSKPAVNGISPNEGMPGTKLTIRGENLGTSPADILYIFVGQYDVGCSVQWHSSRKLNIITPFGEGKLKIIVVTKSAGEGTCDVEYRQSISENVGLQEPVSYWPPNEQKQHQVLMSYAKRTQPKHMQSEMIEDIQDVMLGHHNVPMNFALSDDELMKLVKCRGSTALTETNFDSVLFLLKYHYKTNYGDLVRTLDSYKTVMAQDRMKEPISIVKANLYTIFQCLECLETLKKKIDDEKSSTREISGAFAEKNLQCKLEECKSIAHHMYEEVLKRKDYGDSARSALSVMQRFKFLFNLPHSIRDNINKGEYSLVINDYSRARSLFGSSEIRLFQQVYKDVVEVIDKFKEMLKRQLLEMPKQCDAAKVTIRLLRQLEVDYDPAWICLENQREWILQSIRKLSVTALTGQFNYQTHLDKPANTSTRHPIAQFVLELNKLLSTSINEAWSLASYYIESEQFDNIKSLQQTAATANANDNRNGNVGHSPKAENRHAAVENLMLTVTTAYATRMRDSVMHSSLPSGWLVYCLQHVRVAFESITMEELPISSSSMLIGLLEELRVGCVCAVLDHAKQDIGSLAAKESWSTEISDSIGAITLLPVQYRHIMINSFSEVTRIIHSQHKMELPVFSKPPDQIEFTSWISTAMRAFVSCCDSIISRINPAVHASPTMVTTPDTSNSPSDSAASSDMASNLNVSRLLLLMASNCHHCVTVVNPEIVAQITSQGLPGDSAAVLKDVQAAFSELHSRLVDSYIDLRLESMVKSVQQQASYDWQGVISMPTQARGFVHSLLAALSQSHAELELISPHLSRNCIVRMAARMIEELHKSLESTDRNQWCRRGHMQLAVDLGVLEMALVALQPDQGSLTVSKEAMSIMNIMRNAFRLHADELSLVRQALDRERISISQLIRGFQHTGSASQS